MNFLEYIEINKGYVKSLLTDMISIPTVNPPGENYEEMVALLEKECRGLGLKIRKCVTSRDVLKKFGIKAGSRRVSLILDWRVDSKKTLHVTSHYDVVPATDKWKTDPFKAVIRGNRIYGRGAEDMKGTIASIIFALRAMKACYIKPKINLQVSFTPDEEIGGKTGLGYLVQKGLVKADYAMSEGYSGDYISIGNKGVLWAEITVTGKAAHASIPHRGVNAFERLIEIASWIDKLKKKLTMKRTRFPMRDAVSRSPSLVMGGILEGGVKVNVVPGVARFSIDRRLIPEEDVDVAERQLRQIIERFNKKYPDSRVDVKFISKENPSISRKDRLFFNTVSDAIRKIRGRRPYFSLMPGATDLRYFIWKGIPAIGYSARGGESWHTDNEFVYIDSIIETAKVYALIMSELR